MERKILSSFILSLSLAFFLLTGLPVQAQNSNRASRFQSTQEGGKERSG